MPFWKIYKHNSSCHWTYKVDKLKCFFRSLSSAHRKTTIILITILGCVHIYILQSTYVSIIYSYIGDQVSKQHILFLRRFMLLWLENDSWPLHLPVIIVLATNDILLMPVQLSSECYCRSSHLPRIKNCAGVPFAFT